ncbi:unnamed protein product [Fusarium equiseti]|uniref:DUF7703 domain-containing protein n=1 Tax=Fusarium equiseti TaxID=61235 RepID=A0A8J2ND66_FUSEQ|nr:unnamed protein product [Fusarium equiseti]
MPLPAAYSGYTELTYSPKAVLVITTSTLALYNACELIALIFTTFKHRHGLYFWSLLITTLGLLPYAFGWLLGYLHILDDYVSKALASLGWIVLISGQSVVLYSRLHLVLSGVRIQRAVLWMIVVNGIVWHTTQTVMLFTIGPNVDGDNPPRLFVAIEKTQMTFFCAQEFVISGLYLWGAIDILQTSLGNKRKIMWQLLVINLLIVIMDIALLVIVYRGYYTIEQGVKLVIYSIKLKLEFAVLGKLVEVSRSRGGSSVSGTHCANDFVEMSLRERGQRRRGTETTSDCLPEIAHLEDTSTSESPRRMVNKDKSQEASTHHLYDESLKQIFRG